MAKRFNSNAEFSSKAEFNLVDNHRETVTASICLAANNIRNRLHESSQGDLTACIFSGGYGSDLTLPRLFQHFANITLVGRDQALLKKAIVAQGMGENDRLRLFGNLDVTGIHDQLEVLSSTGPTHRVDIAALIQQAGTANWSGLPQQVDLSASICFLSQLVMELVESVGEHHDQFVTLIQTVRLRHLQLMLEQLRPGGIGLLVFDFVSSDTLPALPSLTGEDLERTLRAAIDHNNFFHGLNPQVILHLFENDLRDQLSTSQVCKPWVWKIPGRSYAVTAIMFQKKLG